MMQSSQQDRSLPRFKPVGPLSLFLFVVALPLVLGGSALAQEFVFVTSRLQADPPVGSSGSQLYQNELFLYRNGTQQRLTFTPTESEWDPQPSPSGRFVAYVVNDSVIDWMADSVTEDWQWYLRIMDLESGTVTHEWLLPDSLGLTRYAGGFDIAWNADEQSLLAQLPSDDGVGRIASFALAAAEPEVLTSGIGVHLDYEGGWIATTLNASVAVVNTLSGEVMTLAPGETLGWVDRQVVSGGDGRLQLIDPVTSQVTVLDREAGYYASFSAEPGGDRYAWSRYVPDREETTITITDSRFNSRASWTYSDYVDNVQWLDENSLLLTVLLGERMGIIQLDLRSGTEFVLVGSQFADDMAAVPLYRD